MPQVIGAVSGDGRVVVRDSRAPPGSPFPVDLDLEHVLGDMPNKTFEFRRLTVSPRELQLPRDEVPLLALEQVLRLPAVGSKRFLTTKVDRCVTGEPPRTSDCTRTEPAHRRGLWCSEESFTRRLLCMDCFPALSVLQFQPFGCTHPIRMAVLQGWWHSSSAVGLCSCRWQTWRSWRRVTLC